MVNEAKNENQINWFHEALSEIHNKPCKQRGKRTSLLYFLILNFKKQVILPENCNFQSGVPQNFSNISQHGIIEKQGVQYTCKPALRKKIIAVAETAYCSPEAHEKVCKWLPSV